jgi:3-keto-disaccharide hydrolase
MKLASYSLTILLLALLPRMLVAAGTDEKPTDTTLGAKPPDGAVVLFDGKNLDNWAALDGKTPAKWPVHEGVFTVGHGNIMTRQRFGDFQLHLEFNIPYMPKAHGQGRGNSGVYLTGNHELQVLDSYKLKPQNNDCGAIYQQVTPSVNACKPPLQWQTYDVTFHKAKVENGKVVRKARVTVIQNGAKIIDDAEISITPGGMGVAAGEDGPLMLQDHGNAVEYRNIWIKPLD